MHTKDKKRLLLFLNIPLMAISISSTTLADDESVVITQSLGPTISASTDSIDLQGTTDIIERGGQIRIHDQ